MVGPFSGDTLDLDGVLLGRRFSREQGTKPDGTLKLRAVDDKTADGCNACARPTAKPTQDSVDMLVAVMIAFRSVVSNSCKLWKADIDSAYRRIPARASERWALWVAFLVDGKPFAAGHNAMPFGSIGSVHGWDRIGSLFRHLGRRLLFIPLLRYVDDYFSMDTEELAAHAMTCFARVVRALLGTGAVADSKLESAMPLVVLGLQRPTKVWR
jgi:hypothetical protein